LTKSALSFIISSWLGVFSVLLTKSALPFIISSCLGVFCCWQSQHCPLSYHLALVSSVIDKVSTVLYHIILPWCLLLLTKSATKARWYDKGQCWLCQQQKTPRQDDMIKDSADFVHNRRHQDKMIW
jgi:ABC-type dipeptide/oligopeptide/nickel transport system permease component